MSHVAHLSYRSKNRENALSKKCRAVDRRCASFELKKKGDVGSTQSCTLIMQIARSAFPPPHETDSAREGGVLGVRPARLGPLRPQQPPHARPQHKT